MTHTKRIVRSVFVSVLELGGMKYIHSICTILQEHPEGSKFIIINDCIVKPRFFYKESYNYSFQGQILIIEIVGGSNNALGKMIRKAIGRERDKRTTK